jgi:hypothetical protein
LIVFHNPRYTASSRTTKRLELWQKQQNDIAKFNKAAVVLNGFMF